MECRIRVEGKPTLLGQRFDQRPRARHLMVTANGVLAHIFGKAIFLKIDLSFF